MHEHAPQEIRPGTPPDAPAAAPPSTAPSTEDRFTLRKKFPGDVGAAPLPPPRTPDVRAKRSRRVALALVLFLGVVGVIAYVTQNLPTWRGKSDPPKGKSDPVVKELLKFPEDLRDLG